MYIIRVQYVGHGQRSHTDGKTTHRSCVVVILPTSCTQRSSLDVELKLHQSVASGGGVAHGLIQPVEVVHAVAVAVILPVVVAQGVNGVAEGQSPFYDIIAVVLQYVS